MEFLETVCVLAGMVLAVWALFRIRALMETMLWRFRCLPRPPQSLSCRRCSMGNSSLFWTSLSIGAPWAKCPSVDSTVQKRRQHCPARSQAIYVRCEIVA